MTEENETPEHDELTELEGEFRALYAKAGATSQGVKLMTSVMAVQTDAVHKRVEGGGEVTLGDIFDLLDRQVAMQTAQLYEQTLLQRAALVAQLIHHDCGHDHGLIGVSVRYQPVDDVSGDWIEALRKLTEDGDDSEIVRLTEERTGGKVQEVRTDGHGGCYVVMTEDLTKDQVDNLTTPEAGEEPKQE